MSRENNPAEDTRSSAEAERCPVTGWPIVRPPAWIYHAEHGGFVSRFEKIGTDVICVRSIGSAEPEHIEARAAVLDRVIREAGVEDHPFYLLVDFEGVEGASMATRGASARWMGRIIASFPLVVGFGVPGSISPLIEMARRISARSKGMRIAANYAEAMQLVVAHRAGRSSSTADELAGPALPVRAQEALYLLSRMSLHEDLSAEIPELSPEDPYASVFRVIAAVQTDLRESAARDRAVLDTSLDAIVSIDTNSHVLEFNRAAEQIFGHRREQVLGQDMTELMIPPEYREPHRKGMRHYLETGEGPVLGQRFEITAQRADGEIFPIELAITPVERDEGRIFIAYLRDITARKQAEQVMTEARDQALEASRLKSVFLATMSHEIRTPLNGVMGMNELLLDTDLDEEQAEFARIAYEQASALRTILDDILDFSKIEAGKLQIRPQAFSPRQVFEQVTELFHLRARQKDLRLVADVSPDVPAQVVGDANRLRQVLVNLVGNALKFTAKGSVEMAIERLDSDSGRCRLEFSVRDTGIGISSEDLGRLFDPFEQVHRITERAQGGTGLGLAISRRLVELMEGQMQVESSVGMGSRFYFRLPFETIEGSDAASQDQPVLSGERPSSAAADLTQRILVVDDNPTGLTVAAHLLERLGYAAETVESGQAAIDALSRDAERYAAILMDCHMPEVDGFDTTRRIRAAESGQGRIPIIALTASVLDEDRTRCIESGMDDLLGKPVDRQQLRETLARWLKPTD